MDDTNWETLFWSLMDDLEKIDHEPTLQVWEQYEVAGLELEEEEE